jgi:paraquat-inducible protein A
MSESPLVICEQCDAVWRRPALTGREVASCGRCGAGLGGRPLADLDTVFALVLTGLVAFSLAATEPILTLQTGTFRNEVSMWSAILTVWDQGFSPLSVACALAVFFLPLLQLLLYTHILVPLRRGRRAWRFPLAMHALRLMHPWSMVEVFMLGIVVSVTKLRVIAEVHAGAGAVGLFALTVVLTLLAAVDAQAIWDRAEAIG